VLRGDGKVDVMPAFLAPNKSPTKSRVVSNFPAELNYSEDHVWFEDRWMVASLCDE
jgi:hypothetical protein